ncbi:MAG: bifunctional folylpolyglutamate synthase/dihydrofolate synthase [Spirochaetaceae bacterium]|nr:bifunctional folylpolyglutamate synthase/dihydrofolate synthase [Spirochaetaceae bacterium]
MHIASAEEGFEYLQSFTNLEKQTSFSEREYRLDRVKYLFDKFDSPHNEINLIHIAGSKGKGSTALYAASILKALGFKTGLYASPHVLSFKERISLAGVFFSNSVYAKNIDLIKDFLESESIPFESSPTTFELLTLLAFLIFRHEKCSWAVIETGIGGRLDATNIITPLCSVITPIELEHTDILGTTLKEIAFEKAGIIKNNIPCVTAKQKAEVLEVLKNKAEKENTILTTIDKAIEIKDVLLNEKGTSFSLIFNVDNDNDMLLKKIEKQYRFKTKMLGAFQTGNSALAMLSVKKALERNNISIKAEEFFYNCKKGIAKAFAPGRIEYISLGKSKPALIIDSSHTENSAEKLAETVKSIKKERNIVLIFGVVEGKDYKKIIEKLKNLFTEIIISTPGTFKKSNPQAIYEYLKLELSAINAKVYIEKDPKDAFNSALEKAGKNGLIVTTGSFYMAGEIKKILPTTSKNKAVGYNRKK